MGDRLVRNRRLTDVRYVLESPDYTADLNEIKALGGDGITTPSARSAEQTQIALFWLESSPLQWNRIARTLAAGQRLDRSESARLFGLLNMALTDGYIGSFDTKYYYRYWRPSRQSARQTPTAIRTPAPIRHGPRLVTTPPIPDYDSAHSVEGGVAAAVFRRCFGTDRIAFTTCSLTLPAGSTRDDARAGVALIRDLHRGGGGERSLTDPDRLPLLQRGPRRDRPRPRIGQRAAERYLRPAR